VSESGISAESVVDQSGNQSTKLNMAAKLTEDPRVVSPVSTLLAWHLRLGHPGKKTLKEFLQAAGIKYKSTGDLHCDACGVGKLKNAPRPGLSKNVATEPLERVCFDLSGRQQVKTLGGAEYFGVIVDQATGYIHPVLVKTKDQFVDEFIPGWKELKSVLARK
jgi:hypothetical protein